MLRFGAGYTDLDLPGARKCMSIENVLFWVKEQEIFCNWKERVGFLIHSSPVQEFRKGLMNILLISQHTV